ncbi:MAG: DinB family protein, partial [Flavobacteriales bacterium]|nr:DinB family protein [Flavobacteriales bacterium]
DEVHHRLEADSWNSLQVLEHILGSERGTLAYLMKKTQADWQDIPLVGEEHAEGSRKLNAALISDRKWKAPQVLKVPEGERSLSEMSQYWADLREKMYIFVEQLDQNYHGRQIFKHPISGRLDLYQTLEFLANHVAHHMHQLERIRADFNAA